MSWRLRLSVETILRLTPAVLGSTVFSIAGLCAAHACLDDQALLAAREAIGSSLHTSEFRGFSPPPICPPSREWSNRRVRQIRI